MCPDWELILWPFSVWDNAPTNWATWPEPQLSTFKQINKKTLPPSTVLHTFPNAVCDESWPIMSYHHLGYRDWSRGRCVTQRGPMRDFLWDLTNNHWKKEAHTFWLITSHDDIAQGLMEDMSTAVSCLEEACLCWQRRPTLGKEVKWRAANSGSPDDMVWGPGFGHLWIHYVHL